jgi:hypothetical protein
MQEPGFEKIDPSTNDGRTRLMQLRGMVIAYFKVPTSMKAEVQKIWSKGHPFGALLLCHTYFFCSAVNLVTRLNKYDLHEKRCRS